MNRLNRPIWVAATAVLALAFAGAASAAPAGSGPPSVSHYVLPSGDFDPELCSFPLVENGTDKVTELDSYDANGNLITQIFHDKLTGTVTNPANGISILIGENAAITFDFTNETETWDGLAERFSYPDGSLITQDTGKIVFAPDGSIASENGSHPIADGPGLDAVCTILSGG